jgi:ABC-type branched-subunit amino acid transport system substrate-binding protein
MGPEAPYTFLGFNGPLGCTRASLAAIKKFYPSAKTACVIIPDDGAKPYVVPQIKKAFEEQGIAMVGDTIAYPNEMVDFSPIVAKVAAIKSDLIMHVSGIQEHFAKIVKGLREGGDFRPYGGAVFIDARELSAVAGKEFATNVFTNTLNADDPNSPPLMKELVKRMRQKEPNRPYFFFSEANGLWILARAMEAAQSLDPMAVKDKLEKMGTVETLFGPGTLCGTKTYGIANHAIAHQGQITLIEKGEKKWSGWFDVKLP